jgi:hypothetical protein
MVLPPPSPSISTDSPFLIATAASAAAHKRQLAEAAGSTTHAKSSEEIERRRAAAAKQRAATMSGQARPSARENGNANTAPKVATFLHYPYPSQFAHSTLNVGPSAAPSVPAADRSTHKANGNNNAAASGAGIPNKIRARIKPTVQKSSTLTADAARMKAQYERSVSTNTNTNTNSNANKQATDAVGANNTAAATAAAAGTAVGLQIKARPYVQDVAFQKTLNWASSSTSLIYQKPRYVSLFAFFSLSVFPVS